MRYEDYITVEHVWRFAPKSDYKDFIYQAAGKFEVEEHSTGLMPKPDPTGLIYTLCSGMNTLL